MVKRRKMILFDLVNLGIKYYDYFRASPNGCHEVRGTVYKLDKLTDRQREAILQYDNTSILALQAQFAPEIYKTAVWIGDKCIRGGGIK